MKQLIILAVIAALLTAHARTTFAAEPAARPRIGLVLAGGGAKGGAHVGVLKVLERERVPISCIAGTSIGALVGAGYASGLPASSIETFVRQIDWKAVLGGQGRRGLEPIEQKRARTNYTNQLEFGVGGEGLVVPGGLVDTSGIEDLLRGFVATARMESDFNRLPIPFRAVATDMIAGKMVVLDHGDLATAMRASMAIPGMFAPVETDTQVLADGGQVRNIPVDVARELCADVVIVVNLVEPPSSHEGLRSATQLLMRSMEVMIEANETLQLATLQPGDVRIDVPLGDIATGDFDRMPETIALGEAAAQQMTSQLARFALPETEYLVWRQGITQSQNLNVRVADVRYEGLDRVNPQYLEANGAIHSGDVIRISDISREARRLSTQREFDAVDYRLSNGPDGSVLTWLPHEKEYGPNYLAFDLGMHVSAAGDLAFAVHGSHVRTWVNRFGAEWRNQVTIGSEGLFATSFYQPLDTAQRVFVEPGAQWSLTDEDYFVDGEREARYRLRELAARMEFGVNIGSNAQLRLGYQAAHRETDLKIGSPLLPSFSSRDAGLTLAAVYDSRDSYIAPSRGTATALEVLSADRSFGADRQWRRAELGVGSAVPIGGDVLWLTLAGGTDLGRDLPADRLFALGGPGSLAGFELGELRGAGYWTAGTSYLWKFRELGAVKDNALYLGVRLQAGGVADRLDLVERDAIYSGSLYLTGRTSFGPLTLGVGTNTAKSWSAWLSIGRPLGHSTILERGIFR
jgi:NTE family protein